eukprot:CAMPEP_0176067628 /NCGR_PEP_ID=MMETSP0120_2-20121206/33757_1 /TAXON_ID=160619 /ORGANISM="Kryptoperidinium foliaceum, Strain CCMP 1326" /LENGTH=365 /DNA_ID=CAMNT_0017401247 /DNA_START=43 /DNA_END=1140 /DNA_ORIENTATION=-
MKRSSTTRAGRAAKAPRSDPLRGHVDALVGAIGGAVGALPPSARAMLCALVEGACGTHAGERHEYQARVVEMLEEALQGIEAQKQKAVEVARARVDAVASEKGVRQEALDATRARMAEVEVTIAQMHSAMTAAKAGLAAKIEDMKAQRKAQDAAEAPSRATAKDLDSVKGALEAVQAWQAGSSAPLKAAVDAGRRFRIDSSLLDSLAHVAKKEPSARGGFDAIVIQSIEEAFAKVASDLESTMASGEALRAARVAAAAAAQAAVGEAEAAVNLAREALRAAEQAARVCAAEAKAAERHAGRWLSDAKVVMDAYDELVRDLCSFRTEAMASFMALKALAPEPDFTEKAPLEGVAVEGEVQGVTASE